MFARQPCDPILSSQDVGQWLCVPPFRVVCPYQAFTRALTTFASPERNNDGTEPGGRHADPGPRVQGAPRESAHGLHLARLHQCH